MDLVFQEANAVSYIGTKLENGLITNIWSICALLTKYLIDQGRNVWLFGGGHGN